MSYDHLLVPPAGFLSTTFFFDLAGLSPVLALLCSHNSIDLCVSGVVVILLLHLLLLPRLSSLLLAGIAVDFAGGFFAKLRFCQPLLRRQSAILAAELEPLRQMHSRSDR